MSERLRRWLDKIPNPRDDRRQPKVWLTKKGGQYFHPDNPDTPMTPDEAKTHLEQYDDGLHRVWHLVDPRPIPELHTNGLPTNGTAG